MERSTTEREHALVGEGEYGGAHWQIYRPSSVPADEYERRLRLAVQQAAAQAVKLRLEREAAECGARE